MHIDCLQMIIMQCSSMNLLALSQITNLYDYFVVMGDPNIDTSDKTKDTSCYWSDICDTFSLKNIITRKTCFKKIYCYIDRYIAHK